MIEEGDQSLRKLHNLLSTAAFDPKSSPSGEPGRESRGGDTSRSRAASGTSHFIANTVVNKIEMHTVPEEKDLEEQAKIYGSLTSVSNIGPCATREDDDTATSR